MSADFKDFLKEKIKGKQAVLIGEMHGTNETPALLTNFFAEYVQDNDFNVCLELPISEQKNIDDFLLSGKETIIKSIFFENDGLRTKCYFKLIKSIRELNLKYNKNIKIICVDTDKVFESDSFQNFREKEIAQNIIAFLQSHNKKQAFVILGNIHAAKKRIVFEDVTVVPAGYYVFKKLGKSAANINLMPKKGQANKLIITKTDLDLFAGFSNIYDYTYYLDYVTSAERMDSK